VFPAPRAEAVVDLRAVRDNVAHLRAFVQGRELMAVVKADGYGHGIAESAAAARVGGASWLGVATLDEALALRAAGDTGSILCWLTVPGEDYAPALAAGIEVTASSTDQLAAMLLPARDLGQVVSVQLKADTGLSRGGATAAQWRALVDAARRAELAGVAEVTGVWSHLACGDEPEHPSVDRQLEAFGRAVAAAEAAGLRPRLRHLANSATLLTRPDAWFDLVRPGLAVYGLSPIPQVASAAELGLTPAMTLRASLSLVKQVAAGQGVSYGHTHVTRADTTLGLVPLGYADGIPRHASGRGPVQVAGVRRQVAGRVCMDQFVVDLAGAEAGPGDEVVIFGPGSTGEPTAQDWADAADTISYEIVSRLGGRIRRRFVGADDIGLAR
jgi:alanine racemase